MTATRLDKAAVLRRVEAQLNGSMAAAILGLITIAMSLRAENRGRPSLSLLLAILNESDELQRKEAKP